MCIFDYFLILNYRVTGLVLIVTVGVSFRSHLVFNSGYRYYVTTDTAPKEWTKNRLNIQTKEFVHNSYNYQRIENSGVHEVERRLLK